MLWWLSFSQTLSEAGTVGGECHEDSGGQSFVSLPTSARRLLPAIRSDDPDFVELVAALQARLEDRDTTAPVNELAAQAGFTQHEHDLLFAVPRERNLTLYGLQQVHRQQYEERRLRLTLCDGGFVLPVNTAANRTRLEAMTLTMCYFGVPVPPLPAKNAAHGDCDTNSVRSDNPFAILDSYKADDSNDQDSLEQFIPVTTVRPAPRLLGGAKVEMKTVRVDAFNVTFTVRTTAAFLYGRQGAVRFDLDDRSSFIDAVARLVGANQSINVSLLKSTTGYRPGSAVVPQTFHDIVHDAPTVDPFDFDKIRVVLLQWRQDYPEPPGRNEDDDGLLVPFVHPPDEAPPTGHWRPSVKPIGLVKCVRRGSPPSSRLAESGDVAYLAFNVPFIKKHSGYTPCYRLGTNQYGPWMLVVARILTPGAGLALLAGTPGSLVAHSRLGLVYEKWRVRAVDSEQSFTFTPFATHGGLGFHPEHVSFLVQSVAGMDKRTVHDLHDNEIRYVNVDVTPLHDWSVGVFLAGLNSEAATATVDSSDVGNNIGDNVVKMVGAPPSFRVGLAQCIDRMLTAVTTPGERALLDGVDIWPDGAFWDHEARPVRAAVLPCTALALHQIEDRPFHAASLVAIRPIYRKYTAWVEGKDGKTTSFAFEQDGQFNAFFESVKAILGAVHDDTDEDDYEDYKEDQTELGADVVASRRDLNHVWIRQRAGSNRPQFLVSPKMTQAEWFVVCNQIVGPEIWVTREKTADWYEKDMNKKFAWGYRTSYGNLLSVREHKERYAALVEAREGKGEGQVYYQTNKSKVATKAVGPVEQDTVTDTDTDTDTESDTETDADTLTSLDVCTLCAYWFSAHATVTDKLRHMVDMHGVLHKQLSAARPGVIVTEAPEDESTSAAADKHGEPSTRSGLATPPLQRTPPKNKRGRSGTPSNLDPSYQPSKGKDDGSSSSGEASGVPGSSDNDGSRVAKKRKTAARRAAHDDSTYRPEKDEGDDEADHDLGSAKFVPDDFGDDPAKKRKRFALPKVHDPSYKPSKDGEEEDEDNDEDDNDKDVLDKGKKVKKHRADDLTYHPSRHDAADDDDDDDDRLRQSAVPEYDRDPTDPAGKRLRVIREVRGRAAKAVRQRQANDGPAVAVTIAKAALQPKAKGKANGKGKTKVVKITENKAGSAASTPRRGRSRNATPAL